MRKLKQAVWPYQLGIKVAAPNYGVALSDDALEIDKWCSEILGRRFDAWYGYNDDKDKRIYAFRDEATLLVFKITWGHKKWA